MKVVFVIKTLDHVKGGAERVLCVVASELARRGHDVHIVSFDIPGGRPVYPLDSGVSAWRLGQKDPRQKTTIIDFFRRMWGFRRHMKILNPDIAVGFMDSAYVPLVFGTLDQKIPIIASEHIVPRHYQNKKIEFFLLLMAAFRANRMTVVTSQVKKLFPMWIQHKIIPMKNPVFFPADHKTPKKETTEKIILHIGRFDPQKDHTTLIAAFALCAPQFPDWNLHLIGDGPLREEIHAQINACGLGNRVKWTPQTDDVSTVYRAADIFAFPSLYESFGLVVAEALAHGVPVLAFADCPGVNILIQDGENGLLVRGQDRVQTFADGLMRLMNDADLRVRFSRQGPSSVASYAASPVVDAWEELLAFAVRATPK